MRRIAPLLALLVLIAVPAVAADRDDVMKSIQDFTDGFNKGDVAAATAPCENAVAIIDEFPPHVWHGDGSIAQWMSDYDADAKKNGITDGHVTLAKAKYVDVTDDRAYVVVPATYVYKLKGKPVKENGSMFTLALHKGDAGWKITGWAWAKK